MSKQQHAPGDLELVRAFVNTLDIERGTDALATPPELGAWLSEAGLEPDPARRQPSAGELAGAVRVREALRTILLAHNDGSTEPADAWAELDTAAARARLQVRFDPAGAALVVPSAAGVDGSIGRLLAIVHRALADPESWRRLKACRLHTCEWVFYDHTKNRSGTWCNMAVCGNRAKARAYRERRSVAGS